jgi:hypothetical protein
MNHSQAKAPLQMEGAMQAVSQRATSCAPDLWNSGSLSQMLRSIFRQVYQFLNENGLISTAELLAEERSLLAVCIMLLSGSRLVMAC